MSNISQKLTYLNDTKTKLKNVINYAGGNITNDTFRSYPEKLYNEFVDFVTNGTDSLYSSLPKVTGENTELTLNNTANAVLKLDFKGNTSQKNTSGKNKFDKNVVAKIGLGNNDDIILETGKRLKFTRQEAITGAVYVIYALMDLTNYVGKTIRFKTSFEASASNNGKYYIGLCDSDGNNRTVKQTAIQSGQLLSFVVPELSENQTYLCMTLYTNVNGTCNTNDYVDYTDMILTIDNEDMSYEPYTNGPSPNPDYPQQIHVVTGDNDVKIENRNLAQHIDGYINASGVFKVGTTDSFYFPVTQGETYIYNNSGNRDRVAIFNSIPTNNQTCIEKTNTYLAKNKPFVASATGYMVIYANTPTSETVKNDFIAIKGNTIGNYTPHQEQTYRVSLGTLELCKIGDYQDYIYKDSDKWYKKPIILKIASYSGETITTDYISTTGQLTTGATVYYVNPTANPNGIEITDTTLISQLEAIESAMSYENQTNISQTNADLPFVISASAIKKYSE